MEKYTFIVQGSADEPYQVVFRRNGTVINAQCSCPAGISGQYCKHRIRILHGETEGIISQNIDCVSIVSSWLPGSNIENALIKVNEAEKNLALAKKALLDAKKELALSFRGM